MKTRYALFLMLTAWLSVFCVQTSMAQAKQDALYIYRNDGGFNAFFYGDIDHIEYSKIDTLGVEHDDYVVQEVYALDTLYRIPVSAIDSVSFVTPETVYKKDVAYTNESDLWNYIVKGDSTQLVLAENIPASMIPNVGDKLVRLDETDNLDFGVFAVVTNVSKNGGNTVLDYEPLSLDELFETYVAKVAFESSDEENDARTRGEINKSSTPISKDFELPNINFPSTNLAGLAGLLTKKCPGGTFLFTGTGDFALYAKPTINFRAFINVGSEGIHCTFTTRCLLTAESILKGNGSITFRMDKGKGDSYEGLVLASKSFWIPKTPFTFNYEGGVSFAISGSGIFNKKFYSKTSYIAHEQYYESYLGLVSPTIALLDNLQFNSINVDSKVLKSESSSSALGKFSSQFTVFCSIGFSAFSKYVSEIKIRAEVGPKMDITLDDVPHLDDELPTVIDEYSTRNYDILSKSGSYKTMGFLSAKVITSFVKKTIPALMVSPTPITFLTYDGSLLPPVRSTESETLGSSLFMTAKIKGYCPNYVYPGFAIYSDGNYLAEAFNSEAYNQVADDFKMNFYDLKDGIYNVYPTFQHLGLKFLATPASKVVIGTPELEVKPEELTFPSTGGSETVVCTPKLFEIVEPEYGDGYGDWWLCKKDSNNYIITVKENEDGNERLSHISFTSSFKDRNPKTIDFKTVFITQEGITNLSVQPQIIGLSGYNKGFKDGKFTDKILVKWLKEADYINVSSNQPLWLSIGTKWLDSKDDDKYTTAYREYSVTPNTNFENPRKATIIVDLHYGNHWEKDTVSVTQDPMKPTMELSTDDVKLMPESEEGAAYSNTVTVYMDSNLFDESVAPFIKDQQAIPSDDTWLKAVIVDRSIDIRATANTTGEDRKGTVTYTIVMKDGGTLTKTIKVTQFKKTVTPPFTTSPKKVSFSAEGGEMKVSIIGENVKRIKEIDCMSSKWLGGAASGTTVTLSAQPNPDEEERIGTVYLTVEMNDGSLVWHYFLVHQDGTNTGELPEGWPTREVVDHLVDQGMPIHYGDEPPTLNGVYELSPYVTIASYSDSERGAASMVVRLISQSDGTIKFNSYSTYADGNKDGVILISTDSGKKEYDVTGYMMGSDGKFSIAIPIAQLKANANWPAGTFGMVISGEKDGDTIRNLYISETHFSSTSLYGIVKDGDGVSNHTVWNPYVDDEE